jgi:hypothetical protein
MYMVKDIPLQRKNGREGAEGEGLIKFMENRHGFKRSYVDFDFQLIVADETNFRKAQYEKLFRDWNWVKNQTKEDYKVVGQKIEERRKRGRDTDVYLKGELVPKKKLKKEISRQGYMKIAEQINQAKGLFFQI